MYNPHEWSWIGAGYDAIVSYPHDEDVEFDGRMEEEGNQDEDVESLRLLVEARKPRRPLDRLRAGKKKYNELTYVASKINA